LDVLLEAMGRLEPGRVTLVIVGAGPDRAQLEATAARLGVAATFAGHLDREALRERYRAADVLAFPSRDDAWGLVLNEGMVAGCVPVASSAAGAVDDLILPGVTGEVVPPGDAAALAEALLLLLDRERLPAMSRAAAVHARRFSPARCAGGYVELLARLPG
jgi:glycosyltransferase involved in cell wall biosynthesis